MAANPHWADWACRYNRKNRRHDAQRSFNCRWGVHFTAHISGNLVIVAAHYLTGGFSEVGPLLAVPVFIAPLGMVTLASVALEKAGYGARRALLVLQAASWQGAWDSASSLAPSAMPTVRWRCWWACSESRRWPLIIRW